MNGNGWTWQKLALGAAITILTGLIGAGLLGIIETFRQVDRLDERMLTLQQRDSTQTTFILENVKRITELWEHQAMQDRQSEEVTRRLDALDQHYRTLMQHLPRPER